jgi:hypothetical protein
MVFQWISLAASTLDRKIRAMMAKVIFDHQQPKPKSVRQVLLDHKANLTQSLIGEAFLANDLYSNDPAVATWMRDNSVSSDRAQDFASLAKRFADELNVTPDLDAHIKILTDVLHDVEMTDITGTEPMNTAYFNQCFNFMMNNYAKDSTRVFNAMNFQSTTDFNSRHYIRESWSTARSPPYWAPPAGSSPKFEDHKRALNNLLTKLQDPNIPDAVVVTVLSDSLATAGYSRMSNVRFPLFINLFPNNWIHAHRDAIWERRKEGTEDEDGEIISPSTVDEAAATEIMENIHDKLSTMDFNGIQDFIDEYQDRDLENEQEPEEEEETPEDPPVPSRPQSPQPPPPPPPQPTIPDDTSYIPNQQMSLKVRDLTSWLKKQTTLPDEKDHMKRFGTTTYEPVPTRKIDLLSTDTRIFQGPNILSQMYMVTYTRTNRKPIFNPVN